MNILQFCLSSGLGGLELYVYRCADALRDNHQVTAVLRQDSKLDEYFIKHSSDINRVHINRTRNPLPIVRARQLARLIDNRKIDLVHMHWGKDLTLAAMAKALSKRKPKLVYTRQMMITRYKNDIYHRYLYSKLDMMITITKQLEGLCKKFISADNVDFRTLYYGVKAPREFLNPDEINSRRLDLGLEQNDFVAGLFGRLEDGKGQHLLIKAIAKIKTNLRNSPRPVKALIVGHEMDQGYRDELVKLATDLGVVENIVFNDFVSNPQELMQVCDCVCLTSYEETFGLVLPEAMRAGVAVIGSNSGGVPEIIDHRETGLLFKSQNENDLYEQLAWYVNNPEDRKQLAEQGKAKADREFDNDEHFKKLEDTLVALQSK